MVWSLLPRKYISHRVKMMRTNFNVEILTFGSRGIKHPPPPTLWLQACQRVSQKFRFQIFVSIYYVIIFWLDPREMSIHITGANNLKSFIYVWFILNYFCVLIISKKELWEIYRFYIERYFAKVLLLTKHFWFVF